MLKNVSFITMLLALFVMTAFFFSVSRDDVATASSEGSLESALVKDLSDRVKTLETKLEAGQDKAEEKTAQPDYSEHFIKMATALEKMAEKSDKLDDISVSLEKIVERLTNIEEELAWSRIDNEDQQ